MPAKQDRLRIYFSGSDSIKRSPVPLSEIWECVGLVRTIFDIRIMEISGTLPALSIYRLHRLQDLLFIFPLQRANAECPPNIAMPSNNWCVCLQSKRMLWGWRYKKRCSSLFVWEVWMVAWLWSCKVNYWVLVMRLLVVYNLITWL